MIGVRTFAYFLSTNIFSVVKIINNDDNILFYILLCLVKYHARVKKD